MAEETQPQGIVIDADAWDPIARNTLKYNGKSYAAFSFQQLRGDAQERIGRTDEHLKGATIADAKRFLVVAVREFAPDAPESDLANEPIEKLYWMLTSVLAPERSAAARPTRRGRKSGSRRSTAR